MADTVSPPPKRFAHRIPVRLRQYWKVLALLAAVIVALVVAMFIYFSPILYGYAIPESWYQSLMWLPSWR